MIRKHLLIGLLLLVLTTGFALARHSLAQESTPVDADVLLKGGTIYVGDGEAPFVGDVAIVADEIVAVGDFESGEVKLEYDCRGLVICPGFIDLHNHSDTPILRPLTRSAMNYLTQGCTTIVTGNCGAGPIDAGNYYDRIDERGVGVNVAHLIPQGGLRERVIGNDRREATADELDAMRDLVDQAMRDGAWGMTTGLIYVPSSYASTEELIELAKIVGQHDGIYASHIRNEGLDLLDAVDEAVSIGREAGVPTHISHFKSSGQDSWGLVRIAVEKIEQYRASGLVVTADQYPYTASSTSLAATTIPAWARAGGRGEMLKRFDDDEHGPRIRAALTAKLELLDGGQRLQIASFGPRPEWAGMRLSEIAAEERMEPLALIIEIERRGGAAVVNHSINEEDVRFVMTVPWVATASDGGAKMPGPTVPHPRNYGTFPRKLGHYSFREEVVPMEQAIRSATGLPADILQISDRGYLRAGMAADILVFDAEEFIDTATFEQPHQYATGLQQMFVNGQLAISNGKPTGVLAGKALRRTDVNPTDDTGQE